MLFTMIYLAGVSAQQHISAGFVSSGLPNLIGMASSKPLAEPGITPRYDLCKSALPPIKYMAQETVGLKGLVYFVIAMIIVIFLFAQASKGARGTLIRILAGIFGVLLFGGVILTVAAHNGGVGCGS